MSVRQLKGGWTVRFAYLDAAGRQREYYRSGFPSPTAAHAHEEKVRDAIAPQGEEARMLRGAVTVADYATLWEKTTLRASTRSSGLPTTLGRLRNHVLPAIGHLPLDAMRKSHGERMRLELRKKALSPKTINHCLALAKKLLADAVDEGLIERNPWQRLSLERAAAADWDWLRPHELRRFLVAARERYPQWYLEILLACRAGLRASEVAGLFVEDCDLIAGAIHVRRSVVRGEVQDCKSTRSHRTVIAPADLLAELRARAKVALTRPSLLRRDATGKLHGGHFLAANARGEPHRYLPETLERAVTGSCRAARLRRITHRDLRHTFASHLRLQGLPLEDIRDLLGHAALQTTLRYAHITAERFAEAARALEELA